MMPLRKSPTLPPDQAARPFFAESMILLLTAEGDVFEPTAGWRSHVESPKRNCTENDERSLNVIENTGCGNGISWNVIDKTGG
jgi:hypothetical protein